NSKLKTKSFKIDEWIEDFEYISTSVFSKEQTLEEILKYRLMQNEDWKGLIIDAEKVIYFERQLNFWFYKIGISLEKDKFDQSWLTDNNLRNKFKDVTIKMNILFSDKGIDRQGAFSDRIFE